MSSLHHKISHGTVNGTTNKIESALDEKSISTTPLPSTSSMSLLKSHKDKISSLSKPSSMHSTSSMSGLGSLGNSSMSSMNKSSKTIPATLSNSHVAKVSPISVNPSSLPLDKRVLFRVGPSSLDQSVILVDGQYVVRKIAQNGLEKVGR